MPFGIRHFYDDESMKDISRSIAGGGLLQPILVTKSDKPGRYNLIVGSRRLKGTMANGTTEIPGILKDNLSSREIKILALSENVQREDLTPFEEAWVVFDLVKNEKMGIAAVAKSLGKHETWVRRRMKYLSVPDEVKNLVLEGKLSFHNVECLVSSVTDPALQIKFATEAVFHRFGPCELREYIADYEAAAVKSKLQKPQDEASVPAQPERFRQTLGDSESRMLRIIKTMTTKKLVMKLTLIRKTMRVVFRSFKQRKAEDIYNLIVEMKKVRAQLDKDIQKAEEEYGYLLLSLE